MEIRLHGRGGQGGVTCAKLLARVYAELGRSVQAFGDYAGERSGAPVRAFLRVGDGPIENRNKVYRPDHLIVLDPTLLTADALDGLAPGGLLLVNSADPPESFPAATRAYRLAVVDATAIARARGIGSRTVVIVNTTLAGAFMRAMDLPLDALECVYQHEDLQDDLPAAREAWEAVRILPPDKAESSGGRAAARPPATPKAAAPEVVPLIGHRSGPAPLLKTGSWRSQRPEYARRPAPCSASCPAGNDVIGFVQALARSGEAEAAAVLARTTPFPGVCGRVCPAPCMGSCNRAGLDGAVQVRGIERWIADHAAAARPEVARAAEPRRIAIVGGGPAGLSAAYTLAVRGHRATVLESGRALGGLLRSGIPSYRLPREVLERELEGVLAAGVDARCGVVLDRGDLAALGRDCDAVILATGQQKTSPLLVPGTWLAGVHDGLLFLQDLDAGRAPALQGHVAVVGGGNTAMDCARSALRAGAERVTVVYRRSRADMPAIPAEVEEAEEEGVRFLFLRQPLAIERRGRVCGMVLAEMELGEPDEGGRPRPIATDRKERMSCDAVLLALGQSADVSLLPAGWELRGGRAWHEGRPLTVFAAGDFADPAGTVAHAIGDGRRAALEALAALGEEGGASVPSRPEPALAVPADRIRRWAFARQPGARSLAEPADARTADFREVDLGFGGNAGSEAGRCFSCGFCNFCDTCLRVCPEGIIARADGGYAVDLDYCKGCGICAAECPRGALEMKG